MRKAVLVTACCFLMTGTVWARSTATWSYPLEDIFSTAVRFVRIDKGCSIVDRDASSAYLLFECKEDKRVKRGALELYRKSGSVRAQLSLSDDPSYIEARWLELLGRKLREERGSEIPPSPPPKPDAVQPGHPQGGDKDKRERTEEGGSAR